MRKFEKKQLKELGELEQDMATGLTEQGSAIDTKKTKEALVKMCQSDQIGVLEKVRLLMAYMISQGGLQEQIRKVLMETIDGSLQTAIRHLEKLGVDIAADYKKNKGKHSKARMKEFASRQNTIPLTLMRYVPYIHPIASALVQYELSEEEFPFTSPPPPEYGQAKGKKKPKGNWKKGPGKVEEKEEDDRPLFIVFFLGGVSFSEIRSIYEIGEASKVNIVVGSTSALTPKEFVRELAGLNPKEFKRAIRSAKGNADPSSDLSEDEDGGKKPKDDDDE